MTRFFIIGGQCPRRRIDIQTIYNYLKTNGLTPTSKVEQSDIILVYTCGSLNVNEIKSLRTIKTILKKKPSHSKVFITGCLPKINPTLLNGFNGTRIIERQELCKLDSFINATVPFTEIPDAPIVNNIPYLYDDTLLRKIRNNFLLDPIFFRDGLRYLKKRISTNNMYFYGKDIYNLLIARGCLGNCTYCAIKLAHGKLRSKPIEVIVKGLQEGLNKGYDRFMLLAADVGCYGIDMKTTIVTLLKELLSIKGDYQIEFSGINPQWLIRYHDQLIPLIRQNAHRIANLIVPIQSGSGRILNLMGRGYKIDDVKECLFEIRKQIPGLQVRTHIIVGFPGETKEDFSKTYKLLSEFHFDHVELYLYDDRPVTKAYHMANKVPRHIVKKRGNNIRRIINKGAGQA